MYDIVALQKRFFVALQKRFFVDLKFTGNWTSSIALFFNLATLF